MNANPKSDGLILSQDEVRAVDAAAIHSLGIPSLLLMENAARGVADQLYLYSDLDQVTIICGPGNNGGDGLALARQLAAAGSRSRVLLETGGKPLSTDAQNNLRFLTNSGVSVQDVNGGAGCQDWVSDLPANAWIIDSLLGTGIRGELRPPYNNWAQAINASQAHVLAVDVPSGLNCDDGSCGADCVRAELTVTFVGMKRGFLAPTASTYTGRIVVAHIGIPQLWIQNWLQQRRSEQL